MLKSTGTVDFRFHLKKSLLKKQMWKAQDMIERITYRSDKKICMSVEQYENHTFDTGQTIDEQTSSFISVDSEYSKSPISELLQDEKPIYIPINDVNPRTLEENEVIMICRCNFKKWTKDFSCFARNDQASEEDEDLKKMKTCFMMRTKL